MKNHFDYDSPAEFIRFALNSLNTAKAIHAIKKHRAGDESHIHSGCVEKTWLSSIADVSTFLRMACDAIDSQLGVKPDFSIRPMLESLSQGPREIGPAIDVDGRIISTSQEGSKSKE